MSFLYRCGCAADEVGQLFERGGLLVCPVHKEPVGLHLGGPVEVPWRGTATIRFELETRDHEEAATFVHDLGEAIVANDLVRALEQTLEERARA